MKTVFIIPGFTELATDSQYKKLKQLFKATNTKVLVVPIQWKRKVMSDYVQQFEEFYAKHKTETNTVLGFSFGAIIAFLTASNLKPNRLLLCSLSPYFQEDLPYIPNSWKKYMGKKRIQDFEKYSFSKIAPHVKSKTTIYLGETEARQYPQVEKRGQQAAKKIPNNKSIVIPKAKHNIGQKEYFEAIKTTI